MLGYSYDEDATAQLLRRKSCERDVVSPGIVVLKGVVYVLSQLVLEVVDNLELPVHYLTYVQICVLRSDLDTFGKKFDEVDKDYCS